MDRLGFILILLNFEISIVHFGNAGTISRHKGQRVSQTEQEELESVLRLLTSKTKHQINHLQSKDSLVDRELKELLEKFLVRRRQDNNDKSKETRKAGSNAGPSELGDSLDKTEKRRNQERTNSKRTQESGGAAKIDSKNPSPDIKKIIAGMGVERNGDEFYPSGVQSNNSGGHNLEILNWTEEQLIEMGLQGDNASSHNVHRNFLVGANLWPMAVVPYEVDTSLDTTDVLDVLQKAIDQFDNLTCVRFKPYTAALASELGHNSFLRFYSGGGCSSFVGWTKGEPQNLSLKKPGCISVGIAIHEMCHAIGMQHEQSRSDRDDYVKINSDNIKEGYEGNFGKSSTLDLNSYDYESIMHYGLWDFGISGAQTIEVKDPNLAFLVDSASGLMFYDAEDITARYGCADHCVNPLECKHGGYVNFECNCHCPPTIKGAQCEEVKTDAGCGGIVDVKLGEEKYITTPNYPNNYNVGAICRWLVRVPAGWYVKMTVEQLHLADDGMALNRCYHWLGIQYNLLAQTEIKRCGDMIGHTYTTTKEGNPNMMLLTFNSQMVPEIAPRKGFKLRVEAVGRGCRIDPCVYGVCKESELDCQYICFCDLGFNGTNCDTLLEDKTIECTFDYNTKCFMKNSKNDDFQWAINSGATSSRGTGPHRAYRGSKYVYAEMSSPRKLGDKAVLESSIELPARDRCLTFYYNMYGKNVGSLNVYTGDGSTQNNVWSRSGEQGNKWIKAAVDIPAMNNLKISIEAVRGADWDGDIALDDVQLAPEPCPTGPPECLISAKGEEYAGHLNKTKSGKTCQRWDSQSPHSHSYDGWSDEENYCRNIGGGDDVPWCYTSDPSTRWEYCELPYCYYDECIRSNAGYEYKGKVSRTSSGITCQRWDSQSPHTHQIESLDDQENYCRNPDKESEPWCYTTDTNHRFEYCSIPRCETPPDECLRTVNGKEYFGTVSTTTTGYTCQRWDSQTPHTHSYSFIGDQGNFCRNPDNGESPWCYTTDSNKNWELCDIPYCDDLPCHSHPCKNGGTCSNSGSTYSCNCFNGYTGDDCETKVDTDCMRTPTGWDYKGSENVTQSGYTCQRWDSDSPHSHNKHSLDSESNFCRNPSPNSDLLPWCYTTDSSKRWEYCNISTCEFLTSSCFTTAKGEDYFGVISTTESGETCQRWDSQAPHTHSYGYLSDQQNYCRNPFGEEDKPWCYTTDPDTKWNYCVAQVCSAGNI